MKISDAFREEYGSTSGGFSFGWDHTQKEERRIRDEEAKPYREERFPMARTLCLGCRAHVESVPRVPEDWRLGPKMYVNAGTKNHHDCIELRRSRWKRFQ